MMKNRLRQIRDKVHAAERLSFDDGLALETEADLFTLGELANLVRERESGNFTYYNINEHLNPTNVCVYRCTFCAFRADLKSPRGYVMNDEQILERAAETDRKGIPSFTSSAGCTISCHSSGISMLCGSFISITHGCT